MVEREPHTPIEGGDLKAGMIIKQGAFGGRLYKVLKVKRVNVDYITYPQTPFDSVRTVRMNRISNMEYVRMDEVKKEDS